MTDQMQAWQKRWQNSDIPAWDLKGAHPLFERTLRYAENEGMLTAGAKIFVPACGRAHNAAAMSRMGYEVKAQDIVPEAIERSKVLYADWPRLTLEVGDSLQTNSEDLNAWDMIFDRAAMCALSGDDRLAFVKAATDKLKSGGLFVSIAFSETGEDIGGPPFAMSVEELHKLFDTEYTLVKMEHRKDGSIDDVIKEEVINIWRKKEKN